NDYLRDDAHADRDRPSTDRPHAPYQPASSSIESHLDYYLKYEQYKVDYNNNFATVDNDTYKNNWNGYNTYMNELRVPPLVTWSNGGSYDLKNVPVGVRYKFYTAPAVTYGAMPAAEDCTLITTQTVTGDMSVNL
ncbi:MAG: hypothetical protein ACOCX9_07885, partial [Spirochaetota bacterium]